MDRSRVAFVLAVCVASACAADGPEDDAGHTTTRADGETTAGETGGTSGDGDGDGDGDPECLDAEDPAACCELAGPELDACTAAGCWDVEPATSYGDRCEILEVRDTCFPAVWDGTCFGAIKPDDCQLSPGSEVVYREVAPGEYVFLVGWELCVDGVPGWSHCFVDPEIDPPGCLCACA